MNENYNYKDCLSLFGYASDVHLRSGGICKYCGCGKGDNIDFDIWRQMTVEHLIGQSQKGYRKDIKRLLNLKYPDLSAEELNNYTDIIDKANTITACSFCNSMTSRVQNPVSMETLILDGDENPLELIKQISQCLNEIYQEKKNTVVWKLDSVRKAFNEQVKPALLEARKRNS